MLSDVKKRYSQSLKRSESFLRSKQTVVKSTSITSVRELCLLRNQAECPICGIKLVGKNHNTEHIHPRSLGGLNNDENKIQLCTACNNARNLTMQSMLGSPPYSKNYRAIKTDVDEFILWSELTADGGSVAGNMFPSPQKIFTEARFANNESPIPQRAYGRFSTWDKDVVPNHKVNMNRLETSPSKRNAIEKKPGVITRFFDWVFDYQPQKAKSNVDKEDNANSNLAQVQKDIGPSDSGPEQIQNAGTTEKQPERTVAVDLSQFKMDIKWIIGSKKLSSNGLGQAIIKSMIDRGYEDYNPTSFLKIYGLPRGLKKALETHCNDFLNLGEGDSQWHVELKDEFLMYHKKLEFEVKEKLELNEEKFMLLKEFWAIIKNLKEDSGLTWNRFLENFGIKNTGGESSVLQKSERLCSTLAMDIIVERKDKEHFIKYSSVVEEI
jgi:5-methylcytosine-specific restriction endonuclease McrA